MHIEEGTIIYLGNGLSFIKQSASDSFPEWWVSVREWAFIAATTIHPFRHVQRRDRVVVASLIRERFQSQEIRETETTILKRRNRFSGNFHIPWWKPKPAEFTWNTNKGPVHHSSDRLLEKGEGRRSGSLD